MAVLHMLRKATADGDVDVCPTTREYLPLRKVSYAVGLRR